MSFMTQVRLHPTFKIPDIGSFYIEYTAITSVFSSSPLSWCGCCPPGNNSSLVTGGRSGGSGSVGKEEEDEGGQQVAIQSRGQPT